MESILRSPLGRRVYSRYVSWGGGDEDRAVEAAASNLRIDAATAEVLRSFDKAGIESVLLKGPALAAWYSEDRTRAYLDCDLWVRPVDFQAAEANLTRLGFAQLADERGLPDWWQEHASTWGRSSDGVTIDLHRNLQGIEVDAGTAWSVLCEGRETITVAGHPAQVLPLRARALYVTIHAAHHGTGWGKALLHLERALAVVPEPVWRDAARLATRVGAEDSFAAGLRLVEDGVAMADRLGLPLPESTEVLLRASSPPPVALGFEQLAGATSVRQRLDIMVRKLFPPAGFIRHWWPPSARNRAMLIVGYLYRPIWLARKAPAGFRSWRSARRQVAAGRDG